MKTNYGLIGAAGFVAPRHLRAIRETGGLLKAAVDPSDSVGVIDSYFPDARFFTEFERFDRHVDLLRRRGDKIDIFSICSPNHLHDAHVRFALRSHADAICEKPLVLNPGISTGWLSLRRTPDSACTLSSNCACTRQLRHSVKKLQPSRLARSTMWS